MNALRQLFDEAAEIDDPARRAAFVRAACGEDAAFRERLEHLLRAHEEAGGFLNTPEEPGPMLADQVSERIGRYKLLQKLGEGGYGVVYMAEQTEPVKRRVALKVIKLGMDTRSVIARFEAERQALALMDHPNIAHVLDAGATETGRPYFVMELVRGIKITDYCDQHSLSMPQRLALFVQVCQAVQHAHQKGIIHRDLKPSNILVMSQDDGTPLPKVIDFGIAKATADFQLTDKTLFTRFEMFIGTPAYMSPEQAEFNAADVDTRTDIYALGVLLYELLTGQTPFDSDTLQKAGLEAMRRTIRETEPARPSTRLRTLGDAELSQVAKQRRAEPLKLVSLVRGDLDWVVLKALEKDRTRRYETANALAADVQRHLENQPIAARPPSAWYSFQKMVRRNRVAVAAALVVLSAILLGSAVSVWQAARATSAEREQRELRKQGEVARLRAEEERETARENLYVSDLFGASQALRSGNFGLARSFLDRWRPAPGETDRRGFEWRHLDLRTRGDQISDTPAHDTMIVSLAYSSDGRLLASASRDLTVKLWDAASLQLLHRFTNFTNVPFAVAFSPDGRRLAAGGWEVAHVWDVATRELITSRGHDLTHKLPGTNPQVRLVFSPMDPNLIALGVGASDSALPNGGDVVLWDVPSGRQEILVAAGGRPAFSPDGQRLATGGTETFCKIWDVPSGRLLQTLNCGENVIAVNWSPHDGNVICSTWNGEIQAWDPVVGQLTRRLRGPGLRMRALAVSPDGRTLAAGGVEQAIQLWDLPGGETAGLLRGHGAEIWSLAFSPDGRTLASGDKDGRLMRWAIGPAHTREAIPNVSLADGASETLWPWAVGKPVVSRDGKWLAVPQTDGAVGLWSLANLGLRRRFERERFPLAFSPDSRRLLTLGDEPLCRIWDVESGGLTGEFSFRPGWDREHAAALSPTGHFFAISQRSSKVFLWNPLQNVAAATMELKAWPPSIDFSPDGSLLASGTTEGTGGIFHVPDGKPAATLPRQRGRILTVKFSGDGRWLASAGAENDIHLWDVAHREEAAVLSGHLDGVTSLAFSTDGRILASASIDRTVKFWHLGTRRELASFDHASAVNFVAFAPRDEALLVGEGNKGPLRVWRHAAGASVVVEPDIATDESWSRLLAVAETNLSRRERLTMIPPRDSSASARLIDLGGHYNAGLEETWAVWDHANDLSALRPMMQTLDGVTFDVRGAVVLRNAEPKSRWPASVVGLPVQQACRRLHFLHAANLVTLDYRYERVEPGTEIGRYVMHYEDGSRMEKPILFEEDVANWHIAAEAAQTEAPGKPRVVWTNANFASRRHGRLIALFHSVWENPKPAISISRIDFVSALTKAQPFLLAISVD